MSNVLAEIGIKGPPTRKTFKSSEPCFTPTLQQTGRKVQMDLRSNATIERKVKKCCLCFKSGFFFGLGIKGTSFLTLTRICLFASIHH